MCGKKAEAYAALDSLKLQKGHILPTNSVQIHLGLGGTGDAFACLDRPVDERDQMMRSIHSYPHFDPIREDLRFAALLRTMKLE